MIKNWVIIWEKYDERCFLFNAEILTTLWQQKVWNFSVASMYTIFELKIFSQRFLSKLPILTEMD